MCIYVIIHLNQAICNVTLKIRSRSQNFNGLLPCPDFKILQVWVNLLTHCKDNVHLSILGLNLAASFSNVTLKMRFVMPIYKIHANLGKISWPNLKIMCLKVFLP